MAACSAGSKHGSGNERPKPTASQGGMGAAAGDADVVANAGTSTPNGTSGESAAAGVPVAPGGGLGGMLGDMMDPVDDADAAPATSGTRLRARYYVGEDGSKQFVGWHDTKRDEGCGFGKAQDGKIRCLPNESSALALGYYADGGCTVPLFTTIGSGTCYATTAKYATSFDTATCVSALHTVAPTTPTAVYAGTPANCIKVAEPPAGYLFYSSGGVVAPTEFVAATEQVE